MPASTRKSQLGGRCSICCMPPAACVRKRSKPKMVYDHCNLFGVHGALDEAGATTGTRDGVRDRVALYSLISHEADAASAAGPLLTCIWFRTSSSGSGQAKPLFSKGGLVRGWPGGERGSTGFMEGAIWIGILFSLVSGSPASHLKWYKVNCEPDEDVYGPEERCFCTGKPARAHLHRHLLWRS